MCCSFNQNNVNYATCQHELYAHKHTTNMPAASHRLKYIHKEDEALRIYARQCVTVSGIARRPSIQVQIGHISYNIICISQIINTKYACARNHLMIDD